MTILETLQKADYNLNNLKQFGLTRARATLYTAVILLEKGYPLDSEVEPLLDKWGDVELIPKFEL